MDYVYYFVCRKLLFEGFVRVRLPADGDGQFPACDFLVSDNDNIRDPVHAGLADFLADALFPVIDIASDSGGIDRIADLRCKCAVALRNRNNTHLDR